MLRLMLTDVLWNRIRESLSLSGVYSTEHLRMRVEGILWHFRIGAPWRDLPTEFGPWSSIYNLFNNWSRRGIWEEVFKSIRGELDNEWNFIDGSIVKAHQHSSGARKGEDVAIGQSRGGRTTKIHMLADSFGNPIDFELTEGQVHDIKMAESLLEKSEAETLIGDKGFDSDKLREAARAKNIVPMIPRRENSKKENAEFDKELYKARHLIENLFAKIKHFRSLATRYDKLKRNYASMVYLGCIFVWIKL